MNEFTRMLVMFALAAVSIFAAKYEDSRRQANQNDERWQAVTAKADALTLHAIMIVAVAVMAWLTLGSFGFVQRIGLIHQWSQAQQLLPILFGLLYLAPFAIFAFRTWALMHFDKTL